MAQYGLDRIYFGREWGEAEKGNRKGANAKMDNLTEFIHRIATSLVDNPEQVRVNEIGGRHTSVVELRVAKKDIGKIIGRKGQTASALRTLLKAVSAKENKRTILEIVE
jgi:hypothetical protein